MQEPSFKIESLRPWIDVRFSRSPGPGGQNVNKLNTRVTILFDLSGCPVLSQVQKRRVREQFRTRIARDGWLRISCHRERTQARNRSLAEGRLLELLASATRPVKKRHPTRPTPGSKRRRLDEKRRRGDTKRLRTRPAAE